jgi:hypothetical protein
MIFFVAITIGLLVNMSLSGRVADSVGCYGKASAVYCPICSCLVDLYSLVGIWLINYHRVLHHHRVCGPHHESVAS